MKCDLKCIIYAIGGWHVLHHILAPHFNIPVNHLWGFKVPQCRGEAWLQVSHDPLHKDIFGGTVHAEERSPGPRKGKVESMTRSRSGEVRDRSQGHQSGCI